MESIKANVMVAMQTKDTENTLCVSIFPVNLGIHNILAFDYTVSTHFDILKVLDTHPYNILLYLNADPEVINKLIDEDILRFVDHVFVTGCQYCVPKAIKLAEGFTYLPEYVDVDELAKKIIEVLKTTP